MTATRLLPIWRSRIHVLRHDKLRPIRPRLSDLLPNCIVSSPSPRGPPSKHLHGCRPSSCHHPLSHGHGGRAWLDPRPGARTTPADLPISLDPTLVSSCVDTILTA